MSTDGLSTGCRTDEGVTKATLKCTEITYLVDLKSARACIALANKVIGEGWCQRVSHVRCEAYEKVAS
jgi:hypothetical protein